MQRLLDRQAVLAFNSKSILSDEDRHLVALIQVVQQRAESVRIRLEPRAVRLRAELCAVWARECVVNETLELIVATGLTEVCRVRVHPVEVRRAVYELDLFGREFGEAVAKDFLHVRRVRAEVDRIRVPANGEVQRVLRGCDI